jgi:cold shock CspA family protein
MPEGTVKWFNETKEFGFLPIEDGFDMYVHGHNDLRRLMY